MFLKKGKTIVLGALICMTMLFTACRETKQPPTDLSNTEIELEGSSETPTKEDNIDSDTETTIEDRQLLAPASVYSDLEKAINKLTTATDESTTEEAP